MPNCVTEDQLTDALHDSAPGPASLDAWGTARAHQVLARVETDRLPTTRRARRWVLIVAAASAIMIAVTTLPLWAPASGPGAPVVVQAADRLVSSTQTLQAIPDGSFEKVVIRSDPYSRRMNRSNTVTVWKDNTGCEWTKGESSRWFTYTIDPNPPVTGVVKASDIPHRAASADALRTLLLKGADEPSVAAQDDIVFETAARWLLEGSPTPTVRTALVKMMNRLSSTTVSDNATDPLGRSAIVMTHTDSGTGMVESVYFDPSTSHVLAVTDITGGNVVESKRLVTERAVVTDLPADVQRRLGTRKQHLKDPEPYFTFAPRP